MNRLITISILLLNSCTNNYEIENTHPWISPEDYFTKVKIIDNYYIEMEYVPIAKMVGDAYGVLNSDELELRKKEYYGYRYFTAKIGMANGKSNVLKEEQGDSNSYEQRLNSFLNGQGNFKLHTKDQTFDCTIYHFERYYNTVPYDKILLGFTQQAFEGENNSIAVVFKDEILGLGTLTFEFLKDDIIKTN